MVSRLTYTQPSHVVARVPPSLFPSTRTTHPPEKHVNMAHEWILFNRGPMEPTQAEHVLEQKLRMLFNFDLDEVERNPHGDTAKNFRSFMVSDLLL